MNKHRELAKERLTDAEAELMALETLAIRAANWMGTGVGGHVVSPFKGALQQRDQEAAYGRLLERARKHVAHCRDMVAEKGDKQYSKWQFYTPVIRGKAEVSGGFTTEQDADGNYWCKWSLREKLRDFAGIPSYYNHWTEERSFKTRRAAMNRVSRELEKWEKKKSIRLPKPPPRVR